MSDALLALLAGAIGASIGGFLQIRNRRLDQLRERQIAAADDFAAGALDVFIALSARMEALGNPSPGEEEAWLAEMQAAADAAREQTHAVSRRLARLHLLFGPSGVPTTSGLAIAQHLLKMTETLRKPGGDPANELRVITEEWNHAAEAIDRFSASTHEIVALPHWRQWLNRISGRSREKPAPAHVDGEESHEAGRQAE